MMRTYNYVVIKLEYHYIFPVSIHNIPHGASSQSRGRVAIVSYNIILSLSSCPKSASRRSINFVVTRVKRRSTLLPTSAGPQAGWQATTSGERQCGRGPVASVVSGWCSARFGLLVSFFVELCCSGKTCSRPLRRWWDSVASSSTGVGDSVHQMDSSSEVESHAYRKSRSLAAVCFYSRSRVSNCRTVVKVRYQPGMSFTHRRPLQRRFLAR